MMAICALVGLALGIAISCLMESESESGKGETNDIFVYQQKKSKGRHNDHC